jgi:hypothetical protein
LYAAFGDPAAMIKGDANRGKTRERALRALNDTECVVWRLFRGRGARETPCIELWHGADLDRVRIELMRLLSQ